MYVYCNNSKFERNIEKEKKKQKQKHFLLFSSIFSSDDQDELKKSIGEISSITEKEPIPKTKLEEEDKKTKNNTMESEVGNENENKTDEPTTMLPTSIKEMNEMLKEPANTIVNSNSTKDKNTTVEHNDEKDDDEIKKKMMMMTTDANLTSSGCSFNGSFYEIGHILMDGCEQRCECLENGQMECLERCSIPFFKKGHFENDPFCIETPSNVDECCVFAACRSNNNNGVGEARGKIFKMTKYKM